VCLQILCTPKAHKGVKTRHLQEESELSTESTRRTNMRFPSEDSKPICRCLHDDYVVQVEFLHINACLVTELGTCKFGGIFSVVFA
jgi:hypothetical protein